MLPCDICSKSGHSWFDCPQRSTKPADWKPQRMMISSSGRRFGKTAHQHQQTAITTKFTKGQQVLADPVVTDGCAPQPSDGPVFDTEKSRGPGRPKTIEDMKAYKAQKARERRAKLKAQKEAVKGGEL